MRQVYMLVPLLQIEQELSIEVQVEKIINISRNQFLVHEINQSAYCIEVQNFDLSFTEINQILAQKMEMQAKFRIMESTLQNFQINGRENQLHSENLETLISKAKKYKQVKQQNKKLRRLLQIQLQNTEKVREQTQKTMKTLKQEFDALVGQMNKNHIGSKHNSGGKGQGVHQLRAYQQSR